MNKNTTLNNFISEYQFKESISDEELLTITDIFENLKVKISKKIMHNILSYSKVLECHQLERLQSRLILN